MTKRRYTDEEKQEWVRMFHAGYASRHIAAATGAGKTCVQKWLSRLCADYKQLVSEHRSRAGIDSAVSRGCHDKELWAQLYRDGLSMVEIAKATGAGRTTIALWMPRLFPKAEYDQLKLQRLKRDKFNG